MLVAGLPMQWRIMEGAVRISRTAKVKKNLIMTVPIRRRIFFMKHPAPETVADPCTPGKMGPDSPLQPVYSSHYIIAALGSRAAFGRRSVNVRTQCT